MDEDYMLGLKVHCLAKGIRLDPDVIRVLTVDGSRPLTIHEYATTGGVTLRIEDVYINAPFDDWYCIRSEALLALDTSGGFEVQYGGRAVSCEVLPLPGYLGLLNDRGETVSRTTMSHCDRIRVSPISGCVLDCAFCDLPGVRYARHSTEEILASVEVAKRDRNLPAEHLLISGGSPGPAHYDWFDDTVCAIAQRCGLATDVMMSPRQGDLSFIQRYVDAGVSGFSFNLEVYGQQRALEVMPRKHTQSTPHMARTIDAALHALGAHGRVRSLVIVGLEDLPSTLEAIRFVAMLGADPVLSPFRPAQHTALERAEPPSEDYLTSVYAAASDIAAQHGVQLGPRCIPCQHNTLTMPVPDGDYWYSTAASAVRPQPVAN